VKYRNLSAAAAAEMSSNTITFVGLKARRFKGGFKRENVLIIMGIA
jgi:hypothetical protein